MTLRKAINKANNKKLRRRREGLSTKCFEYGELDGAELALFIHYPKRGDFYSYMSSELLPWLDNVPAMKSHPKARIEFPNDLRARVQDARRKMKMARDADASTIHTSDTPGSKDAPRPAFTAFPNFECNLATLTKQFRARWQASAWDGLQGI